MVHFFSFIQSEKAALISECFVIFFYQLHSSPQIKVYLKKTEQSLGQESLLVNYEDVIDRSCSFPFEVCKELISEIVATFV